MEIQNRRREQAATNLGIEAPKKQDVVAIQKEEERRAAKMAKRIEIEQSYSYSLAKTTATVMDKYFLDPILGFIPGVGDTLSSLAALPYIYISAFKVKSVPLTLAIIYNVLRDMVVGLIPFWIGNVLDFFVRSNVQNLRLIVGFVEDNRRIINEVNRKAFRSAILIVIFLILVYFIGVLVAKLWTLMMESV